MQIELLKKVDHEVLEAFKTLIPQLTPHSPPPSEELLAEMVGSEAVFVFLAREDDESGTILGSATLATFISPTGKHGWIEDVIVDREERRRGIGRALTEACIEKAHQIGLREVNLTSRPSRKAANQLYQDMGFIQRQTNVYRYPIE